MPDSQPSLRGKAVGSPAKLESGRNAPFFILCLAPTRGLLFPGLPGRVVSQRGEATADRLLLKQAEIKKGVILRAGASPGKHTHTSLSDFNGQLNSQAENTSLLSV